MFFRPRVENRHPCLQSVLVGCSCDVNNLNTWREHKHSHVSWWVIFSPCSPILSLLSSHLLSLTNNTNSFSLVRLKLFLCSVFLAMLWPSLYYLWNLYLILLSSSGSTAMENSITLERSAAYFWNNLLFTGEPLFIWISLKMEVSGEKY